MEMEADLLLRIKIFIRDLLAFQSDEQARLRLTSDPTAEMYMGATYFSPQEAVQLLQTPSPSPSSSQETLHQALQAVILRKAQRGDYAICTSHDMAPIFQRWFQVRKGFQNDPSFCKALKRFVRTKGPNL